MRKTTLFLILLLGVIGIFLAEHVHKSWVDSHTVFPLLETNTKINLGVITENSMDSNKRWYNPITQLKISVHWHEVEPRPNYIRIFGWRVPVLARDYDWRIPDHTLAGFHADWITIKTSPTWAADEICKLPEQRYWSDAARFYQAVIDRYQPRYLEIWNEPNVATAEYPKLFGCIADGDAYGQYVAYIHQQVSGADIIIGAVSDIYDNPFVADMLQAAGDGYDGLSFHCYEQYWNGLLDECSADYDRAKTLTDKPVYLSETAVLWKRGDEAGYESAQVEHFRRMRALPTVWFWYTICSNGWPVEMPTDLCERPVWQEYNDSIRMP
jgi:hypothetical protein